jgi:toluene monooxygenase electron transfer component
VNECACLARLAGPYTIPLKRSFVAIAGGSGIAGMLSIVDHAQEAERFNRHTFALNFQPPTPLSYLLDELATATRESAGGLAIQVVSFDEAPELALSVLHPELRFRNGLLHDAPRDRAATREPRPVHYVA